MAGPNDALPVFIAGASGTDTGSLAEALRGDGRVAVARPLIGAGGSIAFRQSTIDGNTASTNYGGTSANGGGIYLASYNLQTAAGKTDPSGTARAGQPLYLATAAAMLPASTVCT